ALIPLSASRPTSTDSRLTGISHAKPPSMRWYGAAISKYAFAKRVRFAPPGLKRYWSDLSLRATGNSSVVLEQNKTKGVVPTRKLLSHVSYIDRTTSSVSCKRDTGCNANWI